jgi:hypothetical protein
MQRLKYILRDSNFVLGLLPSVQPRQSYCGRRLRLLARISQIMLILKVNGFVVTVNDETLLLFLNELLVYFSIICRRCVDRLL